jgi:hypothetical protein
MMDAIQARTNSAATLSENTGTTYRATGDTVERQASGGEGIAERAGRVSIGPPGNFRKWHFGDIV